MRPPLVTTQPCAHSRGTWVRHDPRVLHREQPRWVHDEVPLQRVHVPLATLQAVQTDGYVVDLKRLLLSIVLFVPALLFTLWSALIEGLYNSHWLSGRWRLWPVAQLHLWNEKTHDQWMRLINPKMYYCACCAKDHCQKTHDSPGFDIHHQAVWFCSKAGCECPERIPIGRRFKRPRLVW